MARLARLVIPGMPHHITQRGNRRQQTFFHDEDYAAYLELTQLPQLSSQRPGFPDAIDKSLHYIRLKFFSGGGDEAPACEVVSLGVRSVG